MVIHQKDFGLEVEVAGGGFVVGPRADPQGRISDSGFLDIEGEVFGNQTGAA